jgi:uncharacterized protein YbcI
VHSPGLCVAAGPGYFARQGLSAVAAANWTFRPSTTEGITLSTPGDTREQLQQISNAIVGLYKTQFGRGPTKSRSDYAGRDAIVCTLEQSLTPAEATMANMGEHARLRDIRMWFQHATEAQFVEAVERITGRKVRGFVSGMDTRQDIATEVFYLEPLADGNGTDSRD